MPTALRCHLAPWIEQAVVHAVSFRSSPTSPTTAPPAQPLRHPPGASRRPRLVQILSLSGGPWPRVDDDGDAPAQLDLPPATSSPPLPPPHQPLPHLVVHDGQRSIVAYLLPAAAKSVGHLAGASSTPGGARGALVELVGWSVAATPPRLQRTFAATTACLAVDRARVVGGDGTELLGFDGGGYPTDVNFAFDVRMALRALFAGGEGGDDDAVDMGDAADSASLRRRRPRLLLERRLAACQRHILLLEGSTTSSDGTSGVDGRGEKRQRRGEVDVSTHRRQRASPAVEAAPPSMTTGPGSTVAATTAHWTKCEETAVAATVDVSRGGGAIEETADDHVMGAKKKKGSAEGSMAAAGASDAQARSPPASRDADAAPPEVSVASPVEFAPDAVDLSSKMTTQTVDSPTSPGLSPRRVRKTFEQRLAELRDFKKKEGHCKVPPSTGSLGLWMRSQRKQYRRWKDGKKTALTEGRRAALEEVGFEWDVGTLHKPFEERLNELRAFRESHGHCNVPAPKVGLGGWVHYQRDCYRLWKEGKESSLTEERRVALEKLGFEWGQRRDAPLHKGKPFEEWLCELRAFRESHGHCNVPAQKVGLGRWVHYQRVCYRHWKEGKKSSMTEERRIALEELGFAWDRRGAVGYPIRREEVA